MQNIKTLVDIGLSEQEASIYLRLLKIGRSSASMIAKEVEIKRTTIYPILQSMVRKGVVAIYFKGSNRFYSAKKPQKLANLFKNKLDALNEIIPNLETIEKKHAEMFGLRFIETPDELKQFYNEILDEYKNKEYYALGNTNVWEDIDKEFFKKFRRRRANAKIKTKLLLSADSKNINPTDKSLLREFKYLPEEYDFKSTIDIFKDKVLIIGPDTAALAVVIAVPAMVDVFKSIFQILWDKTSV